MKFINIFVRILCITLVMFVSNTLAVVCINECSVVEDKGLMQFTIFFFMLEAAIVVLGSIAYFGFKMDARDAQKSKELK